MINSNIVDTEIKSDRKLILPKFFQIMTLVYNFIYLFTNYSINYYKS
jgi:hypothetical protein